MTATQGLHIRKDGTTGTTPVDARLAMAGLVASTGAFGGRPGVLSGCAVSGTTGWAYSVSAGHLVTSRSAGDGVVLWSIPSATLVPTSPAPGSGSRIDIVYAMHNDLDGGDADNLPVIDVVQGVAGAPGAAPSIPVGAIELDRFTVPSGATSTQGATRSGAFTQYTAARGAPIPVQSAAQRDALFASASMDNPMTVVRLDSGAVERSWGSGVDLGGHWRAWAPTITGSTTNPTTSEAYGRYTRIGRTIRGWATFTFATAGSGAYTIAIPEQANIDGVNKVAGTAYMVDVSASNLRRVGVVLLGSGATTVTVVVDGEIAALAHTVPWAWAAGDILRLDFEYENAA